MGIALVIFRFIISPGGRWVAGAAAVALLALGLWLNGVHHGAKKVREQWHAAEQRAIEAGKEARSSAERTVRKRSTHGVRDTDKYNRD